MSKIKPILITAVIALASLYIYRQIQPRLSFLPAI